MQHGLIDDTSLQRMVYETLDHSDDCVLVLEKASDAADDLTVIAANDAFCRASGFGHEELIAQQLRALAADEVGQSRCDELEQAARDRRPVRCELLCRRKNGSPFWFGLHMMPARDHAPTSFVVLGRDITESLRARQQQAAIQGLLAKVFLAVKAPVAIIAHDGLIQMSNPALDELLGYPPGGLVGKSAMECNAPSMRPSIQAARERQIADGRDYTAATKLLRADGSEVSVEITSTTVQREDLRRFRIITVLPRPESGPAMSVRVAGKIKMIGLEEVKESLGPRWNAMAERAMASAEHVIRQRCGPRDICTRTADGGFLICFSDCSEDEAALRAAAIARDVRNKLIGEGDTPAAANVSSIAASIEVPDIPGQSTDAIAAIIDERINTRLAQIEAQARDTLKAALQNRTYRFEQVHSRRTRDVVAQFVKLQVDEENRVLAAYSALSTADRQNFDLDLLVLGHAADQALAQIASGGSRLIMVNLDFDVFLDRRRIERYIGACAALDPRLRERLVPVLYGIPKGLPKSRMLECVLRIRPYCHTVGFEADGLETPPVDFSLLSGANVVLRGERLARPSARDMERLRQLNDELHMHHAHVLARQVPTWSDVQQLSKAGIDMVSVVTDDRDAGTHV
ncbi:MAG TPA: PAS domain-containing protein [Acetobacteraceae bacterium]|nr:PAS domain-containing protein [Acetobacteraceae bacterium]